MLLFATAGHFDMYCIRAAAEGSGPRTTGTKRLAPRLRNCEKIDLAIAFDIPSLTVGVLLNTH